MGSTTATSSSRVTRKGRRLGREKIEGDNRPHRFSTNSKPGAFALTGRPFGLDSTRWALNMNRARQRSEEVRHSNSLGPEHDVEEASDVEEVCDDVVNANIDNNTSSVDHDPTMGRFRFSRSASDSSLDSNLEAFEGMVKTQMEKKNSDNSKGWLLALAILVAVGIATTVGLLVSQNNDRNDGRNPMVFPTQAPLQGERTPSPTIHQQPPYTIVETIEGDADYDKLGQSVSLSGDGSVVAFGIPGATQARIETRTSAGNSTTRIHVSTYANGEYLKLSEDGTVLVVAGWNVLSVYQVNQSKWQWRSSMNWNQLFPSSIFSGRSKPLAWNITSISVEYSNATDAMFIAIGFVDKATSNGGVIVHETILHSSSPVEWTLKADALLFTNSVVELDVAISDAAQLLGVGVYRKWVSTVDMFNSSSHTLGDEVHLYAFDATNQSFVLSGMPHRPTRKLYGMDLVSTGNRTALMAYADLKEIRSFDLDGESGLILRDRGPINNFSPSHSKGTDVDLLLSRDGSTVVLGVLDLVDAAGVVSLMYRYDARTQLYDWGVLIWIVQTKLLEYVGDLSLAISTDGTVLCIGTPTMETEPLNPDTGMVHMIHYPKD